MAKTYSKTLTAYIHEQLKDPATAALYLQEHLLDDGTDDYEQLLLLALRDVAQVHGMDTVAKRAGLSRESLYRTLSAKGNPRLKTLRSLLTALGLGLSVHSRKPISSAVG